MERLYRSTADRKIAGVCDGLGEYFKVDPIIPRIIFVILLFAGVGLLAYLIMWFAVPNKP